MLMYSPWYIYIYIKENDDNFNLWINNRGLNSKFIIIIIIFFHFKTRLYYLRRGKKLLSKINKPQAAANLSESAFISFLQTMK